MSVEERISLDIDYADKYNFMYDCGSWQTRRPH